MRKRLLGFILHRKGEKMGKRIGFCILQGMVWGCVVGTVTCMIMAAVGNEYWFPMEADRYLINMLGGMLVGVGFCVPAVVYYSEKLSMPFKVLVHMGTGYVVYLLTAYFLDWMPLGSLAAMVLYLVIAVVTGFLFWTGFYLYYKILAKKMNERLHRLEKEV